MPAYLSIEKDNKTEYLACRSILTVGRDKNSDIIVNDLRVSRNHAVIRRIGSNNYYLIDSGSANGSYLEGTRVASPVLLKHGTTFSIGSAVFTFLHEEKDSSASTQTKQEDTLLSTYLNVRQITVLVADIRDFTTLSEKLPIAMLSKIMSNWFRQVNRCVEQQYGIVDKFIGDCVYARWEMAENIAAPIDNVLKSACEIKKITDDISSKYLDLPHTLQIGVGINTGQAAVDVGRDNTAIGDTVNIAFRLESMTKVLKKDIVISENTYQYLPKKFSSGRVKTIKVKGKSESIKVCGVNFADIERYLN